MGATRVTYTGRRVRWCGPVRERLQVTAAYQARIARTPPSERVPPSDSDWLDLRPDDRGTVGEQVQEAANGVGPLFAVTFDSGVELVVDLPSRLVVFVDEPIILAS